MNDPVAGGVWVVDASVILKWLRPLEHEPDGELAREAIGRLAMRTTSLAMYEVGSVLVRSGWPAAGVVQALETLLEICGEPFDLLPEDHAAAAELAHAHGLTFYDASYAAIARRTGRRLLSADADLVAPGLAADLSAALA